MPNGGREPMPSRRDPVSSTECDRCPSDNHAVVGTDQQASEAIAAPTLRPSIVALTSRRSAKVPPRYDIGTSQRPAPRLVRIVVVIFLVDPTPGKGTALHCRG